jgi:hypothetical protein
MFYGSDAITNNATGVCEIEKWPPSTLAVETLSRERALAGALSLFREREHAINKKGGKRRS